MGSLTTGSSRVRDSEITQILGSGANKMVDLLLALQVRVQVVDENTRTGVPYTKLWTSFVQDDNSDFKLVGGIHTYRELKPND
ncbi:unnamed protein product [Calypogeia fissa]